ncbi:hypothetical protein KR51_00005480 [Rubidibacter lacunae KORDI 51-2]|uniref:Uncharacterized protein n=1 Tax=Rubidibacter lacunae KORDI 51-2 TaxID=582515 RepID=U5DPC9_9CHRO|nr:hypothetical protein KR51_00005480 [Rubidibacter lacunae KORDI 51-2]
MKQFQPFSASPRYFPYLNLQMKMLQDLLLFDSDSVLEDLVYRVPSNDRTTTIV